MRKSYLDIYLIDCGDIMAFSLLWSLGLIISIMIFAIGFGLILSLKDVSKKNLAIFSIILFISTFILIYFMNLFRTQLNSIIGVYNYLLLFLIAILLIFIGYLVNKNKDNKKSLKLILGLSFISFLLMAFMCIVSKDAIFGLNSLQVSLLTAVLMVLLVIIFYFAFKKINLSISYKGLGSAYYILGLYSIIVSLFLPNIISLDFNEMKPINIGSIESMLLTFVLLIIVAVFGLYYYKRNSMFK